MLGVDMMFIDYCNQTVSFQKKQYDASGDAKYDEYGEPLFSSAKSILVRKTGVTKRVLNAQGNETISQVTVMTMDDVSVGDKIDGKTVINIQEAVDFDGNFVGKLVHL
jgi:hypothetical protein